MLFFFLLGIQTMKFIPEMNTTLGKEKNYIEVFQNSNKTINTYTRRTLDRKNARVSNAVQNNRGNSTPQKSRYAASSLPFHKLYK